MKQMPPRAGYIGEMAELSNYQRIHFTGSRYETIRGGRPVRSLLAAPETRTSLNLREARTIRRGKDYGTNARYSERSRACHMSGSITLIEENLWKSESLVYILSIPCSFMRIAMRASNIRLPVI